MESHSKPLKLSNESLVVSLNPPSIVVESFTPGPWRIGSYEDTVVADEPIDINHPNVKGNGGVNDPAYYGGNLIAENILRKENLHLIAAAPDMYEILNALQLIENEMDFEEVLERANIVLQNAKGQFYNGYRAVKVPEGYAIGTYINGQLNYVEEAVFATKEEAEQSFALYK